MTSSEQVDASSTSTPTIRSVLANLPSEPHNDRCVELALTLCRRHDATLTLAGIVPEPSRLQTMLQLPSTLESAKQESLDDLTSRLDEWRSTSADVEIHTETCVAKPTDALLDLVEKTEADVLIVPTDEGPGQDPAIKSLLRLCPSPVWAVESSRPATHRVLAAVNPDPDERHLNQSIIQHAVNLQSMLGGELYLLAAWEFYGESTLRHSAFLHPPEEEIDRILETEHDSHRRLLEELLESVNLDKSEAHVYLSRGRPDAVIADAVTRFKIEHLVVGTMARSGLSGWFFGNTAERLIDRVECSIFAVKPPEFPAQPNGSVAPTEHQQPEHPTNEP